MAQFKEYQQIISQQGNYVRLDDRTVWPMSTLEIRDDFVDCMVYTTDASNYKVSFRDDEDKKFLGDIGIDYSIYMFLVQRWVVGPYNVDDIVWHDQRVFKCTTVNPGEPGVDLNKWKEIVEGSDTLADMATIQDSHSRILLYKPSYSPSTGNIKVDKLNDHEFHVIWLGDGNVSSYIVKDYNQNTIQGEEPANTNTIDLVFDKDGVYIIELLMDDGSTNYAEVYDLTDAEKCHLEMMKNILCECIDCDDCPGENYNRALNFVNMYNVLRDMIFVEQAIAVGLVSTQVLDVERISMIGLLVAKLALLTDNCTCSK